MDCTEDTCPKHGSLKTRGALVEGLVVSTKPKKTAIIMLQRYRKVTKYERLEKRKSKIAVHVPSCMQVNVGDKVRVSECRKVSKTKSFVLIGQSGAKKDASEKTEKSEKK